MTSRRKTKKAAKRATTFRIHELSPRELGYEASRRTGSAGHRAFRFEPLAGSHAIDAEFDDLASARAAMPRGAKFRPARLGPGRRANPDWAALRARAADYGARASAASRRAYEAAKPRIARGAAATRAAAGRAAIATRDAARRQAKRAAPHVASGLRSLSERMDRFAVANPGRAGRYMTKLEAVAQFRELFPANTFLRRERNGRLYVDEPMRNEAWNDFTDALHKDGLISASQYARWVHAF